jgi:hypothetical protein
MGSQPQPSRSSKPASTGDHLQHTLEELWDGLDKADKLGTIFSIPAIGLTAALVKLIQPSLPGEGLVTFWQVFWGTAPLSCCVAINLIAYFQKLGTAKEHLIFGALTLYAATWIGAHTGNVPFHQAIGDYATFARLSWVGIAFAYILSTLNLYWHLYGDWKFLCSVASGLFVGWFWGTRIMSGSR